MAAAVLHTHRLGVSWVEPTGMSRTGHALRAGVRVWLVDPFDDAEALAATADLGPAAGVIQLLDRHNRDCAALADRLGVPYLRVPTSVPDSPFTVVPIIATPIWNEVALWWADEQALVVAEAVGTSAFFAVGRRAGVHPMLRPWPPRGRLSTHRPEALLVGHGAPLEIGGAAALDDALAHARSDIPRLLLSLPKLLRS